MVGPIKVTLYSDMEGIYYIERSFYDIVEQLFNS